MTAAGHDDLRLRIPGFRRYATELAHLRAEAAAVEGLRARLDELERELRALRAQRGLAPGDDLAADDDEWLARARASEYYWLNAHKKIDLLTLKPFGRIAGRVLQDGRTYLNVDRLYTLWQAVTRMPRSARAVAEVGAYKGGSAKLVAEAIRIASDPPVRFHVCDTFAGHTVVDPALDGRHRVGKGFRSDAGRVAKYLKDYPFLEIVEGDIRETAARFADQQAFGMVHIDVDVYPITRFCLEFFASRLVIGATVVVDDYGFTTCKGVRQAVDEFVAASAERFWAMHLLTGQAVLARVA